MDSEALSFDDAMMEPPAIQPALGGQLLLLVLLLLAVILHGMTIGRPLAPQEKIIADGAAAMFANGDLLRAPPGSEAAFAQAPLLFWLTGASEFLFGANPVSARLPIALATIFFVMAAAFTASLLGGVWRGFLAGMALLFSFGMFGTLFDAPRDLTAGSLWPVFVAAGIYCLVRGVIARRRRGLWALAWWGCSGLACWAGGVPAVAVSLMVIAVSVALSRQARIRFRALWQRAGVLVFLLFVVVWIWLQWPLAAAGNSEKWLPKLFGVVFGGWMSLGKALVGSLPWSLFLILPGWKLAREWLREKDLEFRSALLAGIVVSGFLGAMMNGSCALIAWLGVALLLAENWDILSRRFCLLVIAIGFALPVLDLIVGQWKPLTNADLSHALTGQYLALALIVVAFYFEWQNQHKRAMLTICGAVLAIGAFLL